jgi:hypothetical protein
MKLIRNTLGVAACGLALFGCARQLNAPGAPTTTTSGTVSDTEIQRSIESAPVMYDNASARIADVRCEHELTCEQVGADKRFATREECTRDERRRTRDQLTSAECPNGVDGSKLQSCLASISQKECTDLVFSLQSVEACRGSTLCGAARVAPPAR